MRIRLVSIMVLLFTLSGCDRDQAKELDRSLDTLEANKQAVRYLFETIWNDSDFSALNSVLAPEVRFHYRGTAMLHPGDLRAEVEKWKGSFPDLLFAVEDLVAEKDRVAIRLKFTGTHTGNDWWGFPARGKRIEVSEMMFFRLQHGKIVEAWEEYDEYIMRKQLGQPAAGSDAAR